MEGFGLAEGSPSSLPAMGRDSSKPFQPGFDCQGWNIPGVSGQPHPPHREEFNRFFDELSQYQFFGVFSRFFPAGSGGLLLVCRAPGVHVLQELPQEELHAAVRRSFAVVNSSLSEGMSAAILEVTPAPWAAYSESSPWTWNHLFSLEIGVFDIRISKLVKTKLKYFFLQVLAIKVFFPWTDRFLCFVYLFLKDRR